MKYRLKISSTVFLVVFVGTMFVSLFHMSTGMNMSGGMTDCPFAADQAVICPMSIMDHVNAWQSMFLSTVPTFTLLFVVAASAALLLSVAPHVFSVSRLLHQRYITSFQFHERTYTHCYRPLQELFSSGILHPKLF